MMFRGFDFIAHQGLEFSLQLLINATTSWSSNSGPRVNIQLSAGSVSWLFSPANVLIQKSLRRLCVLVGFCGECIWWSLPRRNAEIAENMLRTAKPGHSLSRRADLCCKDQRNVLYSVARILKCDGLSSHPVTETSAFEGLKS